jgi:hypothetical protein
MCRDRNYVGASSKEPCSGEEVGGVIHYPREPTTAGQLWIDPPWCVGFVAEPIETLRLVSSHDPRTLGLSDMENITNVATVYHPTGRNDRVMEHITLTDH